MEEIPVKVAVRIRPLLCKEVLHKHQICVRDVPNTQQIIIGRDRVFTFDFVFGKNSTQDEVYNICIKPLVLSLIEGYNATVFAYGQTGSGKTYTIGGGHVGKTLNSHFPFYGVCKEFISFVTEHCFIGCALFDFALLMSLGSSPVLDALNAGVWPSV